MSVTDFEIDRSGWMTGEYHAKSLASASKLLDKDGLKCCLGFYSKACGFSDVQIRNVASPSELAHSIPFSDEMEWLLEPSRFREEREDHPHSIECSAASIDLMAFNDAWRLSRTERERRIAEVFAQNGITVKFVGEYPQALTGTPMPDFIHVDGEAA